MVYPHMYRTEHSETRTTNSIYGEYYELSQQKKIPIQAPLLTILQYIDSHGNDFIKDLSEAVEIPSISDNLKHKNDLIRMIKFIEKWMVKLGVKYECFNIGYREVDGQKIKLPPVILGTLGKSPDKKMVCIYAHLDVKSPDIEKWCTDPWTVTRIDKKLYGNGVACGKGPLISWFHAISAFQGNKLEIPVNIKFIIESMNRSGSEGLEGFLATRRQDFLYNVDYVVVCDSEWIGEKYPCLSHGTVGMMHFSLVAEKAPNSSADPKEDLKKIYEALVDETNGQIRIPSFSIFVQQMSPDEEKVYENIHDFNMDDYRESLPEYQKNWSLSKLLMHYWRFPALRTGNIEECICEKQDYSKVRGSFVVKIVPTQVVERISNITINYVKDFCAKEKLGSKVECCLVSATRPWLENIRSPNFIAATRATIQIYKEEPNFIREDRAMIVMNILQRIIDRSILLLPLGNKTGNSGSDNENINLRNFTEGTKLMCAYLFQISYLE